MKCQLMDIDHILVMKQDIVSVCLLSLFIWLMKIVRRPDKAWVSMRRFQNPTAQSRQIRHPVMIEAVSSSSPYRLPEYQSLPGSDHPVTVPRIANNGCGAPQLKVRHDDAFATCCVRLFQGFVPHNAGG